MNKVLIIVLGLFCSLSGYAGEWLSEDRTWNYVNKYYMVTTLQYERDYSFKIISTEEIGGKTYHVFSSNDSDVPMKSYLREEEGRLYMYLTEELRYCYEGESELNRDEVVLYDFSAEEGDSYESVSFDEVGFDHWTFTDVTVLSKSVVTIDGQEAMCQTLEYSTFKEQPFKAIEGIGISRGRLDRPQCAFLTSGTVFDYFFLKTVTDDSGATIFDADGFIDEWDSIEPLTVNTGGIIYVNGVLACSGEMLTVSDMSGKVVAEGFAEVSTESLQPGVYVAKAGSKTLKILVR